MTPNSEVPDQREDSEVSESGGWMEAARIAVREAALTAMVVRLNLLGLSQPGWLPITLASECLMGLDQAGFYLMPPLHLDPVAKALDAQFPGHGFDYKEASDA